MSPADATATTDAEQPAARRAPRARDGAPASLTPLVMALLAAADAALESREHPAALREAPQKD